MAAGLATLASLTPASYDELERLGAALEAGLADAATAAGATVSIARVGSLLTPFFASSAPRNYEQAKRADAAAFTRFFHAMEASHIFMAPSAHEAWFLSLAHSDADIAAVAAAARGAFAA
jgi:glutamate-1-semialdehyde 2,1-aminomutase